MASYIDLRPLPNVNNPRRQHWVSRFYLRWFATPDTTGKEDPDVWLFHKEQGDPFRTSITNVAVETFLYSPQTGEAKRDFETEHKLEKLESVIAPLWKKFATNYVDLKDSTVRKGIGLFLATLFHRNPLRMDDQLILQDKIAPRLASHPNTIKDKLSKEDRQALRGFGNREELKEGFVQHLSYASRPTAEQLIAKRWAIVESDNQAFATSDNPIMVLHEDAMLRSLGFFGGTIMVPVSPTRVMFLDENHAEGDHYYRLKPETLGAFHAIVLRHAIRFLISSRPTDEVLSEMVALGDELEAQDET